MNLSRSHHATDKRPPFQSATITQQRIAADEARAKATINRCLTSPETRERQAMQQRVDLALEEVKNVLVLAENNTPTTDRAMLLCVLQRIVELLSGEEYFDYTKQQWIED